MHTESLPHEFVAKCRERCRFRQAILFGSRARGEARPDSDYDLLLVVADDVRRQEKDELYDVVIDTLLTTGRLFSLKIFREDEFLRLTKLNTPFMKAIASEGVRIE